MRSYVKENPSWLVDLCTKGIGAIIVLSSISGGYNDKFRSPKEIFNIADPEKIFMYMGYNEIMTLLHIPKISTAVIRYLKSIVTAIKINMPKLVDSSITNQTLIEIAFYINNYASSILDNANYTFEGGQKLSYLTFHKNHCCYERVLVHSLITMEQWSSKNGPHRLGGPAVLEHHDNGRKKRMVWAVEGKVQRKGGPAIIEWHENGKLKKVEWYNDNYLHRTDGPAKVVRDEDGTVADEVWYVNGKLHREDGPACRMWLKGMLVIEDWYINNKHHRTDGPAVTHWHNGFMYEDEWYINGIRVKRHDPWYFDYQD
jgi:hypothetical protein